MMLCGFVAHHTFGVIESLTRLKLFSRPFKDDFRSCSIRLRSALETASAGPQIHIKVYLCEAYVSMPELQAGSGYQVVAP